ncbi:HEPN domain-containing protein [candidate division KSB1 bacterium]|nr:HEPN domain-containing protein [candidate division KSB1 bacterium]
MYSKMFDDEIFGFHAQQAVEKVVKAWPNLLGIVYPRTHDFR